MSKIGNWVYERKLPFATAPAIVRANQKDDYFVHDIEKKLLELIKGLKGARFVMQYKQEVGILSKTLYLLMTTAFGVRTLGEEYVDLSYVDGRGRRRVIWWKRIGFVLSYVLVPYLTEKMAKFAAKRYTENPSNSQAPPLSKLQVCIGKFLKYFTFINVVDVMNLHLGLFYFTGRYYELAKRVFGLRYTFNYVPDERARQSGGNYELLGGAIMLQLLVKYGFSLKQLISDSLGKSTDSGLVSKAEQQKRLVRDMRRGIYRELVEHQTEDNGLDKDDLKGSEASIDVPVVTVIDLEDESQLPYIPTDSRTCMLCLSHMKDPSAATCGHVFCWGCIGEWCKERSECPLCRGPVNPQQTLPLR